MKNERLLRVDIVSDVVCPWCIIGYKQLERAAQDTGTKLDVHWHPFELNPRLGDAGENLRTHLANKYGTTPEASERARAKLTALGANLGFTFSYAEDMNMYPTFRAHQLLHWADTHGSKHALKLALFEAYFTHHRNINDPGVLADAAAAVGLDRAEALAALGDGRFESAVREEERRWLSRGIRGVPAMVFNERQLVQGAQGVDNYRTVLRQLSEGRAA